VRALLARRVVVDARNLYDPARMATHGLHYVSLGRPSHPAADRAAAPRPTVPRPVGVPGVPSLT
jgi:hypothetical protein